MTLLIVIKNSQGLVLAAESAEVYLVTNGFGRQFRFTTRTKAKKILTFRRPHNFVAVVTYGRGTINERTPDDYRKEFEMTLPQRRLSVKEFATKLARFFDEKWDLSQDKKEYVQETDFDMRFCLGGFSKNDPYSAAYLLSIPDKPQLREISDGRDSTAFSWVAGWRREIVHERLNDRELNRISTLPVEQVAELAKSHIQTIVNHHARDESGNVMVKSPVVVCTITKTDGSKCW